MHERTRFGEPVVAHQRGGDDGEARATIWGWSRNRSSASSPAAIDRLTSPNVGDATKSDVIACTSRRSLQRSCRRHISGASSRGATPSCRRTSSSIAASWIVALGRSRRPRTRVAAPSSVAPAPAPCRAYAAPARAARGPPRAIACSIASVIIPCRLSHAAARACSSGATPGSRRSSATTARAE